ncbi:hypothetical protein MesoLjLc_27240 [Mesorhizobium sp. L-8-10]|nr:hypothetical protein MesoLjLc_27240 [Mesorhizobium sp. L-8-10]
MCNLHIYLSPTVNRRRRTKFRPLTTQPVLSGKAAANALQWRQPARDIEKRDQMERGRAGAPQDAQPPRVRARPSLAGL